PVRPHVTGAAAGTALLLGSGSHNHADGQSAIAGDGKVLTEEPGILGSPRLSGHSVLVPQHTPRRVCKICAEAVEHQSSIGSHRGKGLQPAGGPGAEPGESVY